LPVYDPLEKYHQQTFFRNSPTPVFSILYFFLSRIYMQTIIGPFKIKPVEPIFFTTKEERIAIIGFRYIK
jgi:hypothetical protein